MASFVTSIIRLVPLRRRYTVVGLIACFALCLVIYSSIPSQPHSLHRLIGSRTNHQLVIPDFQDKARHQWQKYDIPRPLPAGRPESNVGVIPRPRGQPRPAVEGEAPAHRSKLKDGGDVYSGSLAQVVQVKFHFNVSSERIKRLQDNKMLFRQLVKEVEDERAYLAKVQPDYDVNSGSCRCGRSISTECACCARLTMKRFFLERKGCVNFTYVLKDQVLRVRLTYAGSTIAQRVLRSANPPMLCAGTALELCAAFRNVTYKVQLDSPDHKTSLSGCLDLLIRLDTSAIAIYPLGCFRMGRDPKLVHIDKVNNWVP